MSAKIERESMRGSGEDLVDMIANRMSSAEWSLFLRRPLEDAVAAGRTDLADKLLYAGACFGAAFDRAATRSDWGTTHVLAKHLKLGGHDVDCHDVTGEEDVIFKMKPVSPLVTDGLLTLSLRLAAEQDETSVVRILLDAGAGVRTGCALHVAVANDNLSSASLIARDPAGSSDVHVRDLSGRTPLEISACEGHTQITKLLLKAGADVNSKRTVKGHTPLYYAVRGGWWGVVSVLLDHPGVDVNLACGLFQDTPLHLAAQSSFVFTKALLKRGANPNAKSSDGTRPLHNAAARKSASSVLVAKLLIEAGADPNATSSRGRSPLHTAAGVANLEIVSVLLWPGGADDGIKDLSGKTAADMAGKLIDPSKTTKNDIDRVIHLLKQAPVERMWRRRLLLFLYRWYIHGSETRLITFQRQPKRLRVITTPTSGAGIDGCDNSTIIWVFRDTTPEIFRSIMRFL